jgi:hypothetical protein
MAIALPCAPALPMHPTWTSSSLRGPSVALMATSSSPSTTTRLQWSPLMAPPSSPAPLDGTYPNTQQLIPTSYTHTLTCSRTQLLHAIERVSAIGDIIKFTAAESLAITAETDAGSGAESLAVTGTLPACAFNASYLIDGLKAMPGDTVTISANTPTSPVVFTPSGIDGVTYLVMPIQIRG